MRSRNAPTTGSAKGLIAENLPHRLRTHLRGHDVFTVRYKGWSGLKNGELLRIAQEGGFEVFVTGDQTIAFEQNLTGHLIAVVVLSAIEWHIIRHSLSTIQAALDAAAPGSHQAIECGGFSRKLPRPGIRTRMIGGPAHSSDGSRKAGLTVHWLPKVRLVELRRRGLRPVAIPLA